MWRSSSTVFIRMVIDWPAATRVTTPLALDASEMVCDPPKALRGRGCRPPSDGSVGDTYDNDLAESDIGLESPS